MTKSSSVFFELLPFYLTTILYFYFEAYKPTHGLGQLWSSILKVLPIYALVCFTLLHKSKYRLHIVLGLLCSSIGDIFLNLGYFECGMAAFFVAHIWYITCFGWTPKHPIIAIVLYTAGLLSISTFYENLPNQLKIALPIYALAVTTTCWRAIARVTESLPSKLCAIGSVLFVISDSLIAFNMFYADIPNVGLMIMTTYYAAQLGISVVCLDVEKEKM